jgi:hypothetical protein
MTTSNSTVFNATRDVIIRRALRMIGAFASTDSPRPEQINDAAEVLNIMLKSWQMDGMLWLRVWGTLFLNQGQRQYSLAPSTVSGFSHMAVSATPGATAYVQTITTVAAAIGDNHVHLTSATGITNADYIGVANDNGIIEWFFVSVSGLVASLFTNVGLTTPGTLPVAAALGNVVYSHTVLSQGGRPTRVTSAARKLYAPVAADGHEIPLEPPGGISRTDYERLPNKTTQGKIINVHYDPQLVAGQLYVWPTADTPGDKLIITMDRAIQDMVADTDTYDMPQEALNALSYCLARELEPEYPLDGATFQKISAMADAAKTKLLNYNREIAPVAFQMDMR